MDYICHYGRKGMRWGENIFTDKYGRIKSAEGRARYVKDYNTGETYITKYGLEKQNERTQNISSALGKAGKVTEFGSKIAEKESSKIKSLEDAERRARIHEMSDDDLKKLVTRLNLEQNADRLTEKHKKNGGDIAREILQGVGATLAIGMTSVELFGKFMDMREKKHGVITKR